jgi:hypothetical protein
MSGQLHTMTALPPPLPGERDPRTHFIGSCAGLRTGLKNVERKKPFPLLGVELRPLGQLASCITDCATLTPFHRTYIRVK